MGCVDASLTEAWRVVDRDEITAEVAARLVAEQFPQWGDLPVTPVALAGNDNVTFRLGAGFLIRLPSGEGYVGQVGKEQEWLPVLAAQLPVTIPEPVALGAPGAGFPWRWSIYRWLEGEPASVGRVSDMTAFATDLAAFLRALYAIDARGGPPPGQHSAFRGGPVSHWERDARESIELAAGEVDAAAATEVWEAALAARPVEVPAWVHGDVTGSNLLVADGSLTAVIDFGCAAVGDPACDLEMGWTFFERVSSEAFRRGVAVDEPTWARARGWAIWRALVAIAREKKGDVPASVVAHRMGWRHTPQVVVQRIVAEHERATR